MRCIALVVDYFCHFECQFLPVHNHFVVYSQNNIQTLRTLIKNQHDLGLRYVLVILSRFEKTSQTTKSKLTNEKTTTMNSNY